MSRLYEAKVDEKRWKITEIDNKNYHTYKLIDKREEEIYFLRNIIGVEQVKDDEFLVFDRYNIDFFRIARYKAEKSELIKLFDTKFTDFDFITDDRILFTYWDKSHSYRSSGIYSIKDNDYVEDGKWLNGKSVEVFKYDDGNIGIYVEDEMISYMLNRPKLIFTVDSNNLQPNSECYSELRDSFIKVNDKEDIKKIKLEEQRYIGIIEDYIYKKEKEQLEKAKKKVLKKTQIN